MSRHNQDVDQVRDVSSNSSERQARLASEAPFRAIVENAAMGVALFDFAGAVVFTNRALERFLGHDAETLRRRGVAGLSHPDDQADDAVQFARLAAGEIEQYQLDKRFFHASGHVVWGRVTVSVVRGEDGAPTAIVSFIEDVTEAYQSQQALRFLAGASQLLASSLDYETTLQRVADLAVPELGDWCNVYLVDGSGAIRQVALATRDPEKAEILRILGTEYIQPAGNEKVGSAVVKVIRTGQPDFVPYFDSAFAEMRARDANHLSLIRQLNVCSRMVLPLIARGRTLGSIAMGSSESGRHYGSDDLSLATEVARRCAVAIDNAQLYRQATSAVQLRDEFLSVAAHELKTPLTGVLGTSQFLLRVLDRSGNVEPERLRKGLRDLEGQARRLGRLVNQLLDISRLDGGRLVLTRQITDVSALVEGVAALFATRSPEHPIAVQAIGDAFFQVDPLRFEQVVSNLIDNAIKYSPNGGQVDIRVSRTADGGVEIQVADQGVGIAPEHRSRIFDRFYQAHATSYLSGLGLGLYISRQIVEQHGGTLTADFPHSGGTCFVIRLPAEQRPREAP